MSNRFITCTAATLIAALPAMAQASPWTTLAREPESNLDIEFPRGGTRIPRTPAPAPANRATRMMGATDPNLDPTWQWWRQEELHTVFFSPFGQTPQSAQVRLPWYTDGNILKGYELDIYPEDGWVLAYKDFGTPAQAPQFPYFALYNKYRGKFRLMVYKPYQQNSTHYMAELRFMNDVAGQPRSTALLTFRADEKCFLDDYNPAQVDSCMAAMDVYGSWGVFDFDLAGYDPKLNDPTVDPIIQVAIRGVNRSDVVFHSRGEVRLDQVLSTSSLNTSRDANGNLSDAVTRGAKYYKDVKGFQGDLQAAIDNPKNKDEWWLGAAKEIAPMALSAFAPYAGALVGFASAFLGGSKKSAPLEPMRFKGLLDIETTGTITDNQAVLAPFDLFLKPGPQSALAQRPVQPIAWGIYNWTSKPKLTWEDRYIEIWREYPDAQGMMVSERSADEYVDTQISSTVPEVIINPALGMTLVSKKFVYYTGATVPSGSAPYSPGIPQIERPIKSDTSIFKLNSPYSDFYAWNWNSRQLQRPRSMGIELTFRIDGNVIHSDKEIKIIKSCPVEFSFIRKYVDWQLRQ